MHFPGLSSAPSPVVLFQGDRLLGPTGGVDTSQMARVLRDAPLFWPEADGIDVTNGEPLYRGQKIDAERAAMIHGRLVSLRTDLDQGFMQDLAAGFQTRQGLNLVNNGSVALEAIPRGRPRAVWQAEREVIVDPTSDDRAIWKKIVAYLQDLGFRSRQVPVTATVSKEDHDQYGDVVAARINIGGLQIDASTASRFSVQLGGTTYAIRQGMNGFAVDALYIGTQLTLPDHPWLESIGSEYAYENLIDISISDGVASASSDQTPFFPVGSQSWNVRFKPDQGRGLVHGLESLHWFGDMAFTSNGGHQIFLTRPDLQGKQGMRARFSPAETASWQEGKIPQSLDGVVEFQQIAQAKALRGGDFRTRYPLPEILGHWVDERPTVLDLTP